LARTLGAAIRSSPRKTHWSEPARDSAPYEHGRRAGCLASRARTSRTLPRRRLPRVSCASSLPSLRLGQRPPPHAAPARAPGRAFAWAFASSTSDVVIGSLTVLFLSALLSFLHTFQLHSGVLRGGYMSPPHTSCHRSGGRSFAASTRPRASSSHTSNPARLSSPCQPTLSLR
jgi:hypothetical protein